MREGRELVLKLAGKPEYNDRLCSEFEVLSNLDHPGIVRVHESITLHGLAGFLMESAGEETLAQRLRKEGRLHLDLLERFGTDLIEAVGTLESAGVSHRDIKPENIGVRKRGKQSEPHLVLFDFSLSNTPPDQLRCGTAQYLDPFLSDRKPPRWDLQAERFSLAMTLYEMATGDLQRGSLKRCGGSGCPTVRRQSKTPGSSASPPACPVAPPSPPAWRCIREDSSRAEPSC
jgi:serine/threonine protein kinase